MIKPIGQRVLVEAIKKEELKLASGFLISAEWDSAPETVQAKVLAVGEPCGFEPGDVVLIAQFAPTAAREKPSDKTFIVPAEDIMAVIVPDKAAE